MNAAQQAVPWRAGLGYGALGLPLAFVALPLYVLLPLHYADRYGVSLAALGLLLLAARAFDAGVDPLLGRWADRLLAAGPRAAWAVIGGAAGVLALGFVALFFPLVRGESALLVWCGVGLLVTYLAYSTASIVHQAWGARLGGGDAVQARWVSWREGAALAGVIVASVLPSLAGLGWTAATLAVLLLIAWAMLGRVQRVSVPRHETAPTPHAPIWAPWSQPAFRRLIGVYLLNGVASAVPATLVLFFVRDRLQAPAWEGAFLAAYFAAGALSLPVWVRVISAWGLIRSWAAGMVLAVLTFAGAWSLGAGDVAGFMLVCLASGLALGADLAVPGALLAGVVRRSGSGGIAEGAYFGWWNGATKLNLALSAGLVLPALEWAGYRPGSTDGEGLLALSLAYAVLPCVLKLLAGLVLWRSAPAISAGSSTKET
ncbi:sodium:galactoside symporter family protein [Leptothrix cholodnii SP-6]|uniref:Sodium:galactoside symporter family protein n=1 Tax=Leptothrix cholodnii (strain ATCC 51168 / LMG 8142 / SP-6) TaxID=395495 RepID=B1XXX2_LEPCP|nr:MFS transporter [Leptothrix cholodnii]ACB32741.1 sodium:galactoside symporter family protein [Leptothrix cholodnii SP-6]